MSFLNIAGQLVEGLGGTSGLLFLKSLPIVK